VPVTRGSVPNKGYSRRRGRAGEGGAEITVMRPEAGTRKPCSHFCALRPPADECPGRVSRSWNRRNIARAVETVQDREV